MSVARPSSRRCRHAIDDVVHVDACTSQSTRETSTPTPARLLPFDGSPRWCRFSGSTAEQPESWGGGHRQEPGVHRCYRVIKLIVQSPVFMSPETTPVFAGKLSAVHRQQCCHFADRCARVIFSPLPLVDSRFDPDCDSRFLLHKSPCNFYFFFFFISVPSGYFLRYF